FDRTGWELMKMRGGQWRACSYNRFGDRLISRKSRRHKSRDRRAGCGRKKFSFGKLHEISHYSPAQATIEFRYLKPMRAASILGRLKGGSCSMIKCLTPAA